MMTIAKYKNYKDSGIEWLGNIPEHWKLKRVKDIVDMNGSSLPNDTNPDFTFKYIDIGNVSQQGVNEDPELISFQEAPSRARRIVKKHDVIISTVRTYLKAIAFFKSDPIEVIVSTGFAVLSPKYNVHAKFIAYSTQAETFLDVVSINSKGVSYPSIKASQLNEISLPFPPKKEQTQIAQYLDRKTTAIDQKIELLSQKITHYKDYRKTLINDVVTGKKVIENGKLVALPAAQMKESGIEWIGRIPQNWEVRRLKDIIDLRFSNVDKKIKTGQKSVLLCNYTDVYKNDFITNDLSFMKSTASDSEISKFSLEVGDILFTKDSESFDDIANSALVTEQLENVVCGYHLAHIKNNKGLVDSNYLSMLFNSTNYNYWFKINATGITRVGLGIRAIENSMTPIPPKKEQEEIGIFLNQKTQQIDFISLNISLQIKTLKELRKTLINEVVSGKIKVSA